MMNQKTFSIKEKDIIRDWYLVDAEGKSLGRLSSTIARMLQGKHKPEYTPHLDTGDYIVVINAEKVSVLTKPDQKVYHRHSGYIGGMKNIPLDRMREEKPEFIITHAVKGMMPKTKLGRQMMKKLKVYAGSSHEHAAQKPELLNI